MKETFDQGWAADPFKEQFPEMSDRDASHLDEINKAITLLSMADMITYSQFNNIRQKRFPKLVSDYVSKARKKEKMK